MKPRGSPPSSQRLTIRPCPQPHEPSAHPETVNILILSCLGRGMFFPLALQSDLMVRYGKKKQNIVEKKKIRQ